jgi:hypothetical protein
MSRFSDRQYIESCYDQVKGHSPQITLLRRSSGKKRRRLLLRMVIHRVMSTGEGDEQDNE